MHILWFLGLLPNPQTFWVKHVGFILTLGHKTELGDFFSEEIFFSEGVDFGLTQILM